MVQSLPCILVPVSKSIWNLFNVELKVPGTVWCKVHNGSAWLPTQRKGALTRTPAILSSSSSSSTNTNTGKTQIQIQIMIQTQIQIHTQTQLQLQIQTQTQIQIQIQGALSRTPTILSFFPPAAFFVCWEKQCLNCNRNRACQIQGLRSIGQFPLEFKQTRCKICNSCSSNMKPQQKGANHI